MTIQEYYDMLEKHDWYYCFSDDHRYWVAGERSIKELRRLADEHGEAFYTLLEGFFNHHFSGKPWGNEQAPKPERP